MRYSISLGKAKVPTKELGYAWGLPAMGMLQRLQLRWEAKVPDGLHSPPTGLPWEMFCPLRRFRLCVNNMDYVLDWKIDEAPDTRISSLGVSYTPSLLTIGGTITLDMRWAGELWGVAGFFLQNSQIGAELRVTLPENDPNVLYDTTPGSYDLWVTPTLEIETLPAREVSKHA